MIEILNLVKSKNDKDELKVRNIIDVKYKDGCINWKAHQKQQTGKTEFYTFRII